MEETGIRALESLPTDTIRSPSGLKRTQFAKLLCALLACLNLNGGPSYVFTPKSSDLRQEFIRGIVIAWGRW